MPCIGEFCLAYKFRVIFLIISATLCITFKINSTRVSEQTFHGNWRWSFYFLCYDDLAWQIRYLQMHANCESALDHASVPVYVHLPTHCSTYCIAWHISLSCARFPILHLHRARMPAMTNAFPYTVRALPVF